MKFHPPEIEFRRGQRSMGRIQFALDPGALWVACCLIDVVKLKLKVAASQIDTAICLLLSVI